MHRAYKILIPAATVAFFSLSVACSGVTPLPYGPLPSAKQAEWQKMEYYMFAHFGPNTFTDMEWGDGTENPDVFMPADLDCRQWAATAKAAGMKGIILTAKHHDGFCLWPSQYSAHTVRESAWRGGSGDVLKEFADACREYGLKVGFYVSPWDRNHPLYGTPEYNEAFAGMLREVLTGYGPVFELWLDGANGEGPGGKKQEYDWELFHSTIYECQPETMVFSDIGPDCRWIGNENGIAGRTNWSRLDTEGFTPGHGAPTQDTLNSGNKFGKYWVPGEVDVSIRPGWFYSESTDGQVKTVEQLLDIWFFSVGRNANLLLNVPPDRSGRINAADSVRLMELRAALDGIFDDNLASGASVSVENSGGRKASYDPGSILDGSYDSYWTPPNGANEAVLYVDLAKPKSFNVIMLGEYIPMGQRIEKWSVSYEDAATGGWVPLAEATTVGYKRLLRVPETTASRLRISVDRSLAPPMLNGLGLYHD